jgi:hypothetical protein
VVIKGVVLLLFILLLRLLLIHLLFIVLLLSFLRGGGGEGEKETKKENVENKEKTKKKKKKKKKKVAQHAAPASKHQTLRRMSPLASPASAVLLAPLADRRPTKTPSQVVASRSTAVCLYGRIEESRRRAPSDR